MTIGNPYFVCLLYRFGISCLLVREKGRNLMGHMEKGMGFLMKVGKMQNFQKNLFHRIRFSSSVRIR